MSQKNQTPYTYWVFCDESGNLSDNRYLIAAAVGTGNPNLLVNPVRYTSKKDTARKGKSKKKGKNIGSQDYRHATDNPDIARYLLEQVAEIDDLALYIALLDKHSIWNPKISNNLMDHKDLLYNKLFTYLIRQALPVKADMARQPLVILERRDNPKTYKDDLKSKIKIATSLEKEQIKICSKSGKWGPQLQVADSIAWSTFRKYMGKDESFFEIIHDKVELELILGVDRSGNLKAVEDMIS